MFRAIPISHVSVQVLTEQARTAALALAESGVFVPEPDEAVERSLPEDPAEEYRAVLESAQTRLEKLLAHYQLRWPEQARSVRVVELDELAALDEWLRELWAEASDLQERMRRHQEEERRLDSLLATLENFRTLKVDLGLLQGGTRFLDLHLGTVPSANLSRLSEAARLAGYMVISFMHRAGLSYLVVAGPKGNEATLQSVLRAAGWHALQIPEEFRDRPERVAEELERQRDRQQLEHARAQAALARRARELEPRLMRAAEVVLLARPFVEMGEAMRARRGLTLIRGWVPSDKVAALSHRLRRRLGAPVVVVSRPARPGERVPSVIRHPRWLKPFTALVQSFGTPRYGEFDPTWLFALTYVAMFGMMFGDVGHGLVIAGAAFALRKKLKGYTSFPVAAGLSSTLFGVLYGSVFGFEHLLHPLWIAPMSDPVLMLTVALYWGMAFILLVMLLNVVNKLIMRQYAQALLDGKGLAGVVLYAALMAAGHRWMGPGGGASAGPLWLAAASLGLILAHLWRHSDRPYGERFITVAIEGFETLMGLLSGTLSFLRVAAFSLNHVALATAVFALAQMMGEVGHWVMVVLGNLFIIVLEGAIVGIQTMRLEYYEGFSRFFMGDGREFKPLRLRLEVKSRI